MAGELEWEGFASQAQSGVREALSAAGLDCGVHRPAEPDSLRSAGTESAPRIWHVRAIR